VLGIEREAREGKELREQQRAVASFGSRRRGGSSTWRMGGDVLK
jgi:hypothetical protein